MSTEKDKLIQKLLDVVEKKKEAIAKTEKPKWETNCTFPHRRGESTGTNIRTISDINELNYLLAELLQKANAYNEAKKMLGSQGTFKWGNSTVEEWVLDFKTHSNKINLTQLKKDLAEDEEALNKLVSPQRREELELERLTKKYAE